MRPSIHIIIIITYIIKLKSLMYDRSTELPSHHHSLLHKSTAKDCYERIYFDVVVELGDCNLESMLLLH